MRLFFTSLLFILSNPATSGLLLASQAETNLQLLIQEIEDAIYSDLNREGIHQTDEYGRTPLHHAARRQDPKSVEDLLHAGANPNRQDNKGKTPLFLAAFKIREIVCSPRTWEAEKIRENDLQIIKLLLQHNADPNLADDSGYTPLHLLIGTNDTAPKKLLLDAGANPRSPNSSGQSPLHFAAKKAKSHQAMKEIVLLLLYNADLGQEDELEMTPLDFLCNQQPPFRLNKHLKNIISRIKDSSGTKKTKLFQQLNQEFIRTYPETFIL